jgi:hypothetical protein
MNLPKIRSVVADAEHPDGDDKLVLLRVQHEGASGVRLLLRPIIGSPSWEASAYLSVMLIHGQVL